MVSEACSLEHVFFFWVTINNNIKKPQGLNFRNARRSWFAGNGQWKKIHMLRNFPDQTFHNLESRFELNAIFRSTDFEAESYEKSRQVMSSFLKYSSVKAICLPTVYIRFEIGVCCCSFYPSPSRHIWTPHAVTIFTYKIHAFPKCRENSATFFSEGS